MFFDPRRYDLAKVGRYKFNKKLALRNRINGHVLSKDVIDPSTGEVLAEAGTTVTRELADEIQNAAVPFVWIQAESRNVKVLSSLGQKLLKDKLEIAVAVYNPHERLSTFKTKSDTPTYRQWRSDSTVGRCIRLSVSYNFGKQGLYVKRTNAKSDDGGDNIGGNSKGANL